MLCGMFVVLNDVLIVEYECNGYVVVFEKVKIIYGF